MRRYLKPSFILLSVNIHTFDDTNTSGLIMEVLPQTVLGYKVVEYMSMHCITALKSELWIWRYIWPLKFWIKNVGLSNREWWGLWKSEFGAYTKHQLPDPACHMFPELSIFQKKLKMQILMCFLSPFLKHCADQTKPVCLFAASLSELFMQPQMLPSPVGVPRVPICYGLKHAPPPTPMLKF